MKNWMDLIEEEVAGAFASAGYDKDLAKVTRSDRPDLCEYQCNGAMAGAKIYHKAPLSIAEDVTAILKEKVEAGGSVIGRVDAVKPGFINLDANADALVSYANAMAEDADLGLNKVSDPKMIVIDYGGPNVAKPLHVGHLRSAIIGESIKRIARKMGDKVLGDIHLWDWGFQMGLIITEVKHREPNLPYFDPSFTGEYPKKAPFTIGELEEIYPTANAKSKADEAYHKEALHATYLLQNGDRGCRALWQHIMDVSVADLKKNYAKLNVTFDLWKGESDAQPYIPDMIRRMKEEGYARMDQGALVVDVAEDTDTKEVPPCIIQKSDGASLYSTTDLATLVQRMEDYHPDQVIYVVDKRQELHFTQVFRAAKKCRIVPEETTLTFLGFGTMNGKDGKPFKTREGGTMRLEDLLEEIHDEMLKKITDNRTVRPEDEQETADVVGLSAIKYGDLSNQASKDYVFDIDRFTSFEGNTGPYILYTIVRIKSILQKFQEQGGDSNALSMNAVHNENERELLLELVQYNEVMETAYKELAPHKICAYLYDTANALNRFYHETPILNEEDEKTKEDYLALIMLAKDVLETCIDVLGFEAPERM